MGSLEGPRSRRVKLVSSLIIVRIKGTIIDTAIIVLLLTLFFDLHVPSSLGPFAVP